MNRTVLNLNALRGMTPHARLHAYRLLAVHPDLTVTSALRTVERNRAVGGVEGSFHLTGRAVDLAGSRLSIRAAARTARTQRVTPSCTGPEEVVMESDHLHVAW